MVASVSFTPAQESDILVRYQAGQSTKTIAEAVGCSRQPVEGLLRRRGVYGGRSRMRRLTPEQEREAIDRYADGESARAIALSFGCTTGKAVERVLKEHGSYEERFAGFTAAEEDRLVARYQSRESANSLAKEYGVSHGAVVNVLTRRGVYKTRRFQGFTEEDRQAIFAKYREGARPSEIAREFRCSQITIDRMLQRYGVWAPPTSLERIGKRYTMDQKREMIRSYEAGDSIYRIASRVGGAPQMVWKVLRAAGVEFRDNAWRGGRVELEGGYVGVRLEPDDPLFVMANVNGYVGEHRLVMARALGRPLTRKETVHHKDNSDKTDNRIENLQLRQGNHGKGAKFICLDCGSHNVAAAEL